MRYLSVCSGIEAVSVAWQPLGWQPVMFAEIDPFCCWLLRSRYRASRPIFMPSPHDAPDKKEAKRRAAAIRNIVALPADGDVINAGDFTRIGKADVGTIDLLAGGTPCQSFSIAGKRAGLDDPRGNLTIEFARLADRLRPVWVVWENVPGVLSIDGGRTFGAFLGMLVELGYGLAWRILDARYFGVPQRRRRVFVVGHLGDWRAASAVLVERACLSGHSPSRRETRQNIAPTLSARAHGGGGPGTDFDLDGGALPEVSDAASIRAATGGSSNSYVAFSAKDYGADVDDIAPTLRGMGHDGSHANGGGQVAVAWSGELTASSDIAGTLQRGGEGGRADGVMTSQMAVRRLTPRECERLQGFPDDYTLVEYRSRLAADGPRYKALGNSMAVPVMRWIGERIAQVDAILRETGMRRLP
ncbi:MAG: DNA cytosine methyltransferase [Acidobacteriaceae bacterium]